jgi:catechol 2,3-dioxygenase-like lactoylglutathione lyase family enzyme
MEPVNFNSVSPILRVNDLSQALEFYQRTLGFDLAWSWGTPPEIAAVCRDSIEITLTQRADAKPVGASHIYLGISGIDAYYAQMEQLGVTIVVPIDDRAYGMRDFRIADPSGNELSVGQAIAGASEA